MKMYEAVATSCHGDDAFILAAAYCCGDAESVIDEELKVETVRMGMAWKRWSLREIPLAEYRGERPTVLIFRPRYI